MDIISIPKTGENYRLLYDTKGTYRATTLLGKDMIIRARPLLGRRRCRVTHNSDMKEKSQSYETLMP